METLFLAIFASVFVWSGYKHIRNHDAMVNYATPYFGNCPVSKQLGYLSGWPTGVFLVLFGIGAVVGGSSVFAFGLASFLAMANLIFHRDSLEDSGTQKGIALMGAALYIAYHMG